MLDAILDAEASPLFTEPEKAAIALAIESARNVQVSDETFARVRRHFDVREAVELLAQIALANFNNRMTDGFLVDRPEDT